MTTATAPARQPASKDLTPHAITVIAWPDPVVGNATGSIPISSDDALIWWTPTVGSAAMLMAHRFATYAADGPSVWPLVDLAQTFGLGQAIDRVTHTLDRLARFGIIARHGDNGGGAHDAGAVDRSAAGSPARLPGRRLPALTTMSAAWMRRAASRRMSPARFYPP